MGGEDNLERQKTVTATLENKSTPADEALVTALPVVDPACYERLGEVARGGVGRIVRARDRRLARDVAIKQLHDPAKGQARFVREALLTARLQHPAIIPVHEVGRFPSGEAFFAMKLVEGGSMREAIRQRPSLEQRLELLPNVLAVADAMAYAHSVRVIHRDLKPANVLLGAFGETVVIDWGLAKDLTSDDPIERSPATPSSSASSQSSSEPGSAEATKSGTVMGTPTYMPPEQALGAAADERADVYALGALLYHVIAGVPPFEGASATEVLEQVMTREPMPLATRAPTVPGDLRAIVDKAMARRPEERYADARALADDLRRFQLGQIPSLHRAGDDQHDPRLEAAFDVEARVKALRPARVVCFLALTFVPLFAILETLLVKSGRVPLLITRGVTVAIVAALVALSYGRRTRRFSYELGLTAVFVVGAMLVVLNRLEHAQLETGFVASLMLVFIGSAALLHMPSRKVIVVLSLIVAVHLAVSAAVMPASMLVQQMTIFLTGIVIAGLGVRYSFGLQRAEFYSRRRLEEANQRLAKLEQRPETSQKRP